MNTDWLLYYIAWCLRGVQTYWQRNTVRRKTRTISQFAMIISGPDFYWQSRWFNILPRGWYRVQVLPLYRTDFMEITGSCKSDSQTYHCSTLTVLCVRQEHTYSRKKHVIRGPCALVYCYFTALKGTVYVIYSICRKNNNKLTQTQMHWKKLFPMSRKEQNIKQNYQHLMTLTNCSF